MKRLGSCDELILHRPLLLVGEQHAMFEGALFFQFFKAGLHQVGTGFRIEVVDGEFIQSAAQESTFDCAGLGFGEQARARFDFEDPQSRLITREGNAEIEGMTSCPCNQIFRRIAPAQAEGGIEHGLGNRLSRRHPKDRGGEDTKRNTPGHGLSFTGFHPHRKARSTRRGMLLLEAGMALSILTVLGLVLMKFSLNILQPRQWIVQQTLTDAYMTYERAFAERISFDELVDPESPWPAFPNTKVEDVELGRLGGNRPVMGRLTRTRIPDPNNFPINGGTGTPETTNPAGTQAWKVQSVVTYMVGSRHYAKSRTILRTQ